MRIDRYTFQELLKCNYLTSAEVAREADYMSPSHLSRVVDGVIRLTPDTRQRVESALMKLQVVEEDIHKIFRY